MEGVWWGKVRWAGQGEASESGGVTRVEVVGGWVGWDTVGCSLVGNGWG